MASWVRTTRAECEIFFTITSRSNAQRNLSQPFFLVELSPVSSLTQPRPLGIGSSEILKEWAYS
jgi:hypothetical protein